MTEKNAIIKAEQQQQNTNIVPYTFKEGRINKKGCKLCECNFRDEVESWYELQPRKNISEIKRRLKSEKDFDIHFGSIKGHMLFHYLGEKRNALLAEYTQDIQEIVDMRTNNISAIKARMSILDKEVLDIAVEGVSLNIDERRKSAMTINKLSDTLLKYEEKLQELEERFTPVTIVLNHLSIIIKDEVEHVDSNIAKKSLVTVLSKLKERVGGMFIESEN